MSGDETNAQPLWILEDTRQQKDKHTTKHKGFEREGVMLFRSKLAFGDYSLPPRVAVDTKKDIYELSQDLTADHARFKRECVAAHECGTRLIVLVENRNGVRSLADLQRWSEPVRHFQMRKKRSGNRYARRIEGERLAKTCATMTQRYGVVFRFCSPEEAHEKVIRFLKWNGGVPL